MTSITLAGPRCVQELDTILAPQNRIQGRCGLLPGEGPSRGLLRDYEPSDGTFWSFSGAPLLRGYRREASNVFRFGGGDLISCEIVTARLLETTDGNQREEFFNFDIDIYNMRRSWWEDVIMFVTLFCNNRVFRRMFYECKKVFFFNLWFLAVDSRSIIQIQTAC